MQRSFVDVEVVDAKLEEPLAQVESEEVVLTRQGNPVAKSQAKRLKPFGSHDELRASQYAAKTSSLERCE